MINLIEKYIRKNYPDVTNPEELAQLAHNYLVEFSLPEIISDYGETDEE